MNSFVVHSDGSVNLNGTDNTFTFLKNKNEFVDQNNNPSCSDGGMLLN